MKMTQHQVPGFQQRQPALAAQCQDFGQYLPLEEVRKIRPVIRGRLDIKLVARNEAGCISAGECCRGFEEVRPGKHIKPVGLGGQHARVPGEIKGACRAEVTQVRDFRRSKPSVLDQQGAGLPATYQHQLCTRCAIAACLQGLYRRGEQFQRVARRQLDPAADAQVAAGCDACEIVLQGLDRVEVVLVQGMQSGTGCTVGVQHAQLYQVIALPALPDETAGIARLYLHTGARIDVP
jgi:hypothetical protein